MPAATLVGLDIGAMSIRAVEITRGRPRPVVANFALAPLPPGAVQNGVIQDEKAVTAVLKQMWADAKLGSRDVVLGVTNPQVVVREMSVANLPPHELRRSLPFQVRDSLPLPVEQSLLDFYPLEDAEGQESVRGLLIAAPKAAVLTAVRAVERAGLRVGRVDLASFALLRAASTLDETVEAIVDIGAQNTTVVVHADGNPLIVRTIPRGGAEITNLLATRLGVDPVEAETRKCEVGLREDAEPKVAALVREAVRPLLNEIRSSFAYLNSGDRQARVTRVALSGGGALLPGLAEALSAQLEIATVRADPTTRLRNPHRTASRSLDRLRSSAAVSIGLTLGVA